MNPLRELQGQGQSVWVDDIRRRWLEDGTLRRWIEVDGISGVTSNPAIFGRSIAGGGEYAAAIGQHLSAGSSPQQVYERLALEDVRQAADLLAATYRDCDRRDGFVSLEVSPLLADDTAATVTEARRLWRAFDRPNAMIKVPATPAGVPAIAALIAEGINVNVTLIFSLARYREVVDAFLLGLEQRLEQRGTPGTVSSVASFFISRIDTAVDALLDGIDAPVARQLRGGTAIACARLAYDCFGQWTAGQRWQCLEAAGAAAQRLLWASTSVKDPAYDDLKYVEGLVGPHTINTLPPATLEAYRQRGRPTLRLGGDVARAASHLQSLARLGIDMEAVAARLEREGVRKFAEPFERLLAAIDAQQTH